MKMKKWLLFFVIVFVGIVSIETFVFPKIAENCSCRFPEHVVELMCDDKCPDGDCTSIGFSFYGSCYDGQCRTTFQIFCLGTGDISYFAWYEPCVDCLDW